MAFGAEEAMNRRILLTGGSALVGTAISAPAVRAQDKYPSRPIKLVIPFPPGGPTDMMGRLYGEKLAAILGQPVVIDNKAGAGGIVGADLVAKARPDGYTLLLGSSSTQVTGPLLMPNAPYHPVKDFTLFIIGFVPMVISCNPDLPARTLPEFVALLRTNPDKYRCGSSGMGSIGHLGSELFKLKAEGLVSLHVPYKGNNAAVQAALSGEVDWLLDTIGTTLGHHAAGKLRYLAVCAEKRTAVVPELPTTAEGGLPDVLVSTVNPVGLPAGAPTDVVNTIAEATRRIMADEALQADLRALSIEPVAEADRVKSAAYFSAERERWAPIIKASGARME
jgi:tripartite-type tricarboxylate transporter receptor subunit TctC